MSTATLKPWNPNTTRLFAAVALFLPILGAALYHMETFNYIGQQRFIFSLGRGIIIFSMLSMMLMPRAFLRILDRRGPIDEREMQQRMRTFHLSYKIMLLITFGLLTTAAVVANNGMGGKDMRHLLVTIITLIMVYSMIVPFNILAWSMKPPPEDE